jgi:cation diffusion facilitator family transporter
MMLAVKISMAGNILLFAIKLTAVLFLNSLAVITDLGITCVGLGVSGILYYSIKMAQRPADLFHNYGYAKIENVCEAIEGIILIGMATIVSVLAIISLAKPEHVGSPFIGLSVSAVGATINFVGAFFILRMAATSRSPAVKAEGLHYKLEGFISSSIALAFIIAIGLEKTGHGWLNGYVDSTAALAASALIAVPSFRLAKHAFFTLLDASLEEPGKMEVMKHLVAHMDKYCDLKELKTRVAGTKKFIEFKLIMPGDVALRKGHNKTSVIEEDMKKNIHNSEVMIKLEPCKEDCKFIAHGQKCPYAD